MIIETLLGVLIVKGIYQQVKIQQLQKTTTQLRRIQALMEQSDLMIHKRIDQEIDRVDKLHKDSIQYTTSITKQDSAKQLIKG